MRKVKSVRRRWNPHSRLAEVNPVEVDDDPAIGRAMKHIGRSGSLEGTASATTLAQLD